MISDVNITLSGDGLQDADALNIQVSIDAIVNIEAATARRKATAWLVSEVGNMLIGGAPQLLIRRGGTVWQVPVILTSSQRGRVGQAGTIEVDAETGELLISDQLRADVLENVNHLIRPTPSPIG